MQREGDWNRTVSLNERDRKVEREREKERQMKRKITAERKDLEQDGLIE